jgi:hypothetical protein
MLWCSRSPPIRHLVPFVGPAPGRRRWGAAESISRPAIDHRVYATVDDVVDVDFNGLSDKSYEVSSSGRAASGEPLAPPIRLPPLRGRYMAVASEAKAPPRRAVFSRRTMRGVRGASA